MGGWGPVERGRYKASIFESALGDARAEATIKSGQIVLFRSGEGAIVLCVGGIPRKYWGAGTVAGMAAVWGGVEAGRAVG